MHEYFSPFIGTGSKGVLGVSIPFALLSWAAVPAIWQTVAAVVGAYVLVMTAYSITLEVLHRKRRDKKEREEAQRHDSI
jgi:Kef-type K+ transport system membrane component KefB